MKEELLKNTLESSRKNIYTLNVLKKEMKKIIIGFILALLILEGIACEEIKPVITVTVQIKEDGSAIWTVEKRFILRDEVEEKVFEEYTKKPEEELLTNFVVQIEDLMNSIKVDREMAVKDFSILYGKEHTITNIYGVIKYQFLWKNFAKLENNKIIVGDVFEGGYYLSEDEILVFKKPEDYEFLSVAPSPHNVSEDKVSWEGRFDFDQGTPKIILEKVLVKVPSETRLKEEDFKKHILILLLLIIIPIIMLYLYHSRKRSTERLEDKEMLIEIIKKHGGKIYQKELTRESGLSKSKVSNLLNELKKEGKIRKVFKGRENLIEFL